MAAPGGDWGIVGVSLIIDATYIGGGWRSAG
jgi:hypothetical protein